MNRILTGFPTLKFGLSRKVKGVVITDFQMWFHSILWVGSGWGAQIEKIQNFGSISKQNALLKIYQTKIIIEQEK